MNEPWVRGFVVPCIYCSPQPELAGLCIMNIKLDYEQKDLSMSVHISFFHSSIPTSDSLCTCTMYTFNKRLSTFLYL